MRHCSQTNAKTLDTIVWFVINNRFRQLTVSKGTLLSRIKRLPQRLNRRSHIIEIKFNNVNRAMMAKECTKKCAARFAFRVILLIKLMAVFFVFCGCSNSLVSLPRKNNSWSATISLKNRRFDGKRSSTRITSSKAQLSQHILQFGPQDWRPPLKREIKHFHVVVVKRLQK